MKIPTLALLAALSALPAAAQLPELAPERPDSVLSPRPNDAGFVAWRQEVAERGRDGASYLVQGTLFQALVMTPMAIDAMAPDSLIFRTSMGCRGATELPREWVDSTTLIQPWEEFDSATYARPMVAIGVYPFEDQRYDCRSGNLARFAGLSRGIIYGQFRTHTRQTEIAHVEVWRNGQLVPVPITGRQAITKVGNGAVFQDGAVNNRIYLELESFAPATNGVAPSIVLQVWYYGSDLPEVMPLPEPVVRAVWQQMLPWRVQVLANAAGGERRDVPLLLPEPGDSVLKEAHRRYMSGELASGAAMALNRLTYLPLPNRGETRTAMLMAAATLVDYGDDVSAQSLMSDILEVFPCLTLAEGTSPTLGIMADDYRRPARCTTVPLPMIAVRSIIPGGGTWTTPGRRNYALALLGGTAAAFATSSAMHSYADGQYEKYEAHRGSQTTKAFVYGDKAQRGRTFGNALAITGIAVWVYAGVEAIYAERHHARELRAVTDVGAGPATNAASRTPRISPAVTPNGFGLKVEF